MHAGTGWAKKTCRKKPTYKTTALRENIKTTLKSLDWKVWTGFISTGLGPVAGPDEHDNAQLGLKKYEFVVAEILLGPQGLRTTEF